MKKGMIASMFMILLLFVSLQAGAFCGFFVARTDADLFNESSSVILVREGNRTVITMANDFKGDVRDFAMVIPVPEVLARENIRIADPAVFEKLNAYSSPRLAAYYDRNPCHNYRVLSDVPEAFTMAGVKDEMAKKAKNYKVTIEAQYTVGEYDIIILKAEESSGLKRWLTDNGYRIPEKAEQVLKPYILSGSKFFVVKVNLENHASSGYQQLRPLQIAFNSEKFMLPIRLGMANSTGFQDLIIYAFTKKGRIETVNYRTGRIPTNVDVPLFVEDDFNRFYRDLFTKAWDNAGKSAVMLEYAWDLSANNFVKCDPCATTPPAYADLREAGVFWVTPAGSINRGCDYQGELFMTRLHVRYDRAHYPQDLLFQETADRKAFQGRYVIRYPVEEPLTCDAAKDYYRMVAQRRRQELSTLARLTGWDTGPYASYVAEYAAKAGNTDDNPWIEPGFDNRKNAILPGLLFNPVDWREHITPAISALALMICLSMLLWIACSILKRMNP